MSLIFALSTHEVYTAQLNVNDGVKLIYVWSFVNIIYFTYYKKYILLKLHGKPL